MKTNIMTRAAQRKYLAEQQRQQEAVATLPIAKASKRLRKHPPVPFSDRKLRSMPALKALPNTVVGTIQSEFNARPV